MTTLKLATILLHFGAILFIASLKNKEKNEPLSTNKTRLHYSQYSGNKGRFK